MNERKRFEEIDEQALLYSIADESFKMTHPAPVGNTIGKPDMESRNDGVTEVANNPQRMSGEQRKLALGEFRQQFMNPPKIENRKPVFVSDTTRNDLDRIVRLFGERGLSVSGLVENLALHFLEAYKEDIEQWRKM